MRELCLLQLANHTKGLFTEETPTLGGREGVWLQNIYTKILYQVLMERFNKGETDSL